jgi:dihydrofolate reductase
MESNMKVIQIVAADDDFGIGKDNSIPWRNKEDMQHFKESTEGHRIVMGRNTYESLPPKWKPLPKRNTMLLSSSMTLPYNRHYDNDGYVHVYSDMDALMEKVNHLKESYSENLELFLEKGDTDPKLKIFVAGGTQIYDLMLEHSDEIWMSRIPGTHKCDTFYPERFKEIFELDGRKDYKTFKLEIFIVAIIR